MKFGSANAWSSGEALETTEANSTRGSRNTEIDAGMNDKTESGSSQANVGFVDQRADRIQGAAPLSVRRGCWRRCSRNSTFSFPVQHPVN
jgi:hypothetical protein